MRSLFACAWEKSSLPVQCWPCLFSCVWSLFLFCIFFFFLLASKQDIIHLPLPIGGIFKFSISLTYDFGLIHVFLSEAAVEGVEHCSSVAQCKWSSCSNGGSPHRRAGVLEVHPTGESGSESCVYRPCYCKDHRPAAGFFLVSWPMHRADTGMHLKIGWSTCWGIHLDPFRWQFNFHENEEKLWLQSSVSWRKLIFIMCRINLMDYVWHQSGERDVFRLRVQEHIPGFFFSSVSSKYDEYFFSSAVIFL